MRESLPIPNGCSPVPNADVPGCGLADPERRAKLGVRGSALLTHLYEIGFLCTGERMSSPSSGGRHRGRIGEVAPGRPLHGRSDRRVLQLKLVSERPQGSAVSMRTPHLSHHRRGQEHTRAAGLCSGSIRPLFMDMRPGDTADRIVNRVVGKTASRREIAHSRATSVLPPQPTHIIFVQNGGAGLVRISGPGPAERRWIVHPAPGGAIDRLRERPAAHTNRTRKMID